MAFLPDAQDQSQTGTQQTNQNPVVPTIPSLQGTGGPSTGAGTGAGQTNTASPGAAPSAPWQNITTYLQANAPQANQVANTIAGNLTNQYNTANQAISDAGTNFTGQINSANVAENKDMLNAASTDPTKFASDPNNVTAFQKQYNANYGGPADFSHSSDFANIQNQVIQANQQAALAGQGESGLATLMQQAEKNPTQGITDLDTLLLQQDPNNYQTVQNAAAPFSNLAGALSGQQTTLDQLAQQAAQGTAQTKQDYQNAFIGPNGVVPGFQSDLNSRLQGASKQTSDYNNSMSNILAQLGAGKPITPQQSFAIDPGGALQNLMPYGGNGAVFTDMVGNGFPGVNPGMLAQYYTPHPQLNQPGLGNIETNDDVAKGQALNQLLGSDQGILAPQAAPWQLPSSMGTYNDQGALQGLYDTLENDKSALPQMSDQQLQSYLADYKQLSNWLGLPGAANPTPLPPTTDPTPTGPPYLAPPGGPGGTVTSPGGGRHTF